jgi:dipeptidyl aminopeptidase/acylaminoacyl peptidase
MKPFALLLLAALAASAPRSARAQAPVQSRPAAAAQAPQPLTAADFARFRSVSDPQLSPDGHWVAYTVGSVDLKKDKTDSDVWMASWDGTENLRLTSSPEGESSPRWSPDGRWLAFLSSRQEGKGAQVWLLDRRGGEAQRVTEVKGGVSEYAWSPDSKRLVLAVEDQLVPDSLKEKRPIVVDRYHFKDDAAGYIEGAHTHLYLFDIDRRQMDTLTAGRFDEKAPAWSPDGTWIAFVSNRPEAASADPDRDDNTDVFVVEPRKDAAPRRLTTWKGSDGGPLAWSPDSRSIAYIRGGEARMTAYNQPVLAVVGVDGGEPRLYAQSLDRDVRAPRFAPDGRWLYVLVTDDMTGYPARVELTSGKVERLPQGERVVSALALATGERLALTLSAPQQPTEVYALDAGQLRPLSHQNDTVVAAVRLVPMEKLTATTKDGAEVHAALLRPVGYEAGKRYPTLLRIHGGPNGQDAFSFDFERQLFASNGYAVVSPNYRGGSGRGKAWHEAIFADWGHLEVVDVLAAMDQAVKLGVADPERLGIGGWSYGCITTDYAIASDGRFRAATCGAGSALQTTMYGVDEYVVQYDNELGPPWKSQDLWIKLSYPFFHADRIHTPTLFLGGASDFNVPLVGGEQMYQALRTLDVPTQLIVYPNEHHGIRRPTFVKDRYERYLAWYAKYLKATTPTAATSTGP